MNDSHDWEVRVEFDTESPTPADKVEGLTRALMAQPAVSQAWGSLTDRGSAISTGATVIVDASSPGEAINTAIGAFTVAVEAIEVSLREFREATVQHAGVDPRD